MCSFMPYFYHITNRLDDSMGYKKIGHRFGFADLELQHSLGHNRSLRLMENLNAAIDWSRIESVLMSHYTARPVKLVLH